MPLNTSDMLAIEDIITQVLAEINYLLVQGEADGVSIEDALFDVQTFIRFLDGRVGALSDALEGALGVLEHRQEVREHQAFVQACIAEEVSNA